MVPLWAKVAAAAVGSIATLIILILLYFTDYPK